MGNKMKDWLEKNQEVYYKFKSKIHSTLDLLSQNGTDEAECDDTDSLQNMLLEEMAAKNMPVEDLQVPSLKPQKKATWLHIVCIAIWNWECLVV